MRDNSESHSTVVHSMREAASGKADMLNEQALSRLDAFWRAANYLSVGQIYLLDNPLLRGPLKPEHIKPRRWDTGAQHLD